MEPDEQLSIPPEFWLNRQLIKVADPERRAFLHKLFSGQEGYSKFLKIMRQGYGAIEFDTGEWTIKKFTKTERNLKQRPCVGGCGKILPPQFAPWGELIEDFPAICPKCKTHIKPTNTNMADNESDASKDVQDILAKLEEKKQTLKGDLKATLNKAKSQLNVLLNPQLGFTFNEIFADAAFVEIVDAFKIAVKGQKDTSAKSSDSQANNEGLKPIILHVMSDNAERKMSDILKATKGEKVKATEIEWKNAVKELAKDKYLKKKGAGRGTSYVIVK